MLSHNIIPNWCTNSFKSISHHNDTIIIYTSSCYGRVALRLVYNTQNMVLQSCALWLSRVCTITRFFIGGLWNHKIFFSGREKKKSHANEYSTKHHVIKFQMILTTSTAQHCHEFNPEKASPMKQPTIKQLQKKTMQHVIIHPSVKYEIGMLKI